MSEHALQIRYDRLWDEALTWKGRAERAMVEVARLQTNLVAEGKDKARLAAEVDKWRDLHDRQMARAEAAEAEVREIVDGKLVKMREIK